MFFNFFVANNSRYSYNIYICTFFAILIDEVYFVNDFLFSVNAVIPLFILMAVGWFLTRLNVWNSDFLKIANSISFNILIPCNLFCNIYTADFAEVFDPKLLVFVLITVSIVVGVGFLVVPVLSKKRARQGVILQALFRGNFALLGLPLCEALAGAEGAQIASVFLAFLIPAFNILATVILSIYSDNKADSTFDILKKIIKNPLIIGCVLGLIFSFTKPFFTIPNIIYKPLGDLKSVATPFALLVLGGDFKFKSFVDNIKCVISTGLTRTVLIPAIAILFATLLGFRGIHIALIISTFGTPVAVASTAMTYKMNGDYDLACQVVVFTTLCSALTITMFAFITRAIGIL